MAINLSDNILSKTTAPLDAKYGPYTGATLNDAKTAALNYLDLTYRYEGLTVGLKVASDDIIEYWFVGGVTNSDLVLKTTGGGGGGATVSFADSTTISFTQSGFTYSANIREMSLTASLLNTDVYGAPTASYVLTNDENGYFKWLQAPEYNTFLDNSLTVPNTIGGISSGTTVSDLKDRNLVELFDDLLFPTLLPSYVNPTITLSSTVTGIREVGSSYSSTITLTGRENDASSFTSLSIYSSVNGGSSTLLLNSTSLTGTASSDLASQFGFTNSNNPNLSYAIGYLHSGVIVPTYSLSNSTISYSGFGDYSAGLALKNSKGLTDGRTPAVRSTSNPQAAGTNFASSTQTVIGYYPYFYGKTSTQKTASEIKTIIESGSGFTKVVNTGTGNLSMSFNASGEWPWFAVFESYTTKTAWYETPLNSGSIGGASDLFVSPTTLSITSSDGYWIANYKIYPAGKVTTLGTAIIS